MNDSSSSPFLALPAKSRRNYAAILDVGKYPVPKESLQSSEGSGVGRRSKSLLLLVLVTAVGLVVVESVVVVIKRRRSGDGSREDEEGAAQESRKRRRSGEGGGDEGGTRKGKEVRRGLGGTRRISPLQRILSALHLFQDVVFPLRRESHTPPLESLVSSFFAPVPCRVCHFHHRYRDVLRDCPSLPFASSRKSHLPMRFGDGKLKILLITSSLHDVLRTLYSSEYLPPENSQINRLFISKVERDFGNI